MCAKKGGYTGVLITTPSPGSVASSRMAQARHDVGHQMHPPGSTVQPCRAAANLANASPRPAGLAYPQSLRSMARAQRREHRLREVVVHLRDERGQHVRRVSCHFSLRRRRSRSRSRSSNPLRMGQAYRAVGPHDPPGR